MRLLSDEITSLLAAIAEIRVSASHAAERGDPYARQVGIGNALTTESLRN